MFLLASKKSFTLIELAMVLLILGVLLTISTPMFLVHLYRGRASEAVAVMGLIRQGEREYFAKHNAYLDVDSPYISNGPEDSPEGLDIRIAAAQYFSRHAFSVDVPGSSTHFATAPTTPVDFVIKALGSASVQCSGAGTDCAVRQTEVINFELEMDNTGRVFVCYGTCADADNWKSW